MNIFARLVLLFIFLVALSACGGSSDASGPQPAPPATPAPPPPLKAPLGMHVNIQSSDDMSLSGIFSWSPVENAANYKMYYRTDDGEYTSIVTEQTSIELQLIPNVYEWYVEAFESANSKDGVSSAIQTQGVGVWSKVVELNIPSLTQIRQLKEITETHDKQLLSIIGVEIDQQDFSYNQFEVLVKFDNEGNFLSHVWLDDILLNLLPENITLRRPEPQKSPLSVTTFRETSTGDIVVMGTVNEAFTENQSRRLPFIGSMTTDGSVNWFTIFPESENDYYDHFSSFTTHNEFIYVLTTNNEIITVSLNDGVLSNRESIQINVPENQFADRYLDVSDHSIKVNASENLVYIAEHYSNDGSVTCGSVHDASGGSQSTTESYYAFHSCWDILSVEVTLEGTYIDANMVYYEARSLTEVVNASEHSRTNLEYADLLNNVIDIENGSKFHHFDDSFALAKDKNDDIEQDPLHYQIFETCNNQAVCKQRSIASLLEAESTSKLLITAPLIKSTDKTIFIGALLNTGVITDEGRFEQKPLLIKMSVNGQIAPIDLAN